MSAKAAILLEALIISPAKFVPTATKSIRLFDNYYQNLFSGQEVLWIELTGFIGFARVPVGREQLKN